MATFGKKKKNGNPSPIFREIFICSKKELAPYGTVFVASAENYDQGRLGTLFGIFKILDFSSDSSYIANLLTSVIKKEYFNRPERSPEESFEASLRKANLALAELARHGSISWAGKISFAGGVIEGNNLHFSNLGDTSVFLIRSGKIARISQDLEEGKTSEPHPLKTFTDISSGKIEKGDKIILTTSDLLDIFSPDELRHNAARFSQEEFFGLIEASLHSNTDLGSTIIIDFLDPNEISAPFNSNQGRQKIPEETVLLPLPEETKNADTPPAVPEKKAPIISEIIMPPPKEKKADLYIKEETETQTASFASKIYSPLKNLYLASSKIISSSFRNLAEFTRRLKVKEKMFFLFRGKMRPGHLVEKITGHSRYFAGRLSRIDSKKKKLYSGITLAVVLVFIIGIIAYKNSHKRIISQLVIQPNPQTETSSAPSAFEDTQAKTVSALDSVVSLSRSAQTLIMLNGSLFSMPENSKTVLKINPESKTVEENLCSLDVGNFKLMASMPNLNALFILTEDNKVVSFTPINKNFQENTIALPAGLSAEDIKTYLTYIYLLDPKANQIYRYPRAEGGFGDQQSWLKSGTDISNAIGFAINDDLFVASANGFQAYTQGKKDESFNMKFPKIPIAIDKIFTEPDFNGIYVLDTKNHRVLVYDKQGNIAAQYFNDSISIIKDFTVDEQNKIVYILSNSNQIQKFSLE
jgi:hypothetical protein